MLAFRRLLLEGAERTELALGGNDLFHGSGTGRADELVLEVLHAHEETQLFHVGASEVRAKAGPLETAPEVTLLGGIAEAGQFDVRATRAELIEEPPDRLGPAHRNDGDALGGKVAATALGQRLERQLVACPFDEHHRPGGLVCVGCAHSSMGAHPHLPGDEFSLACRSNHR